MSENAIKGVGLWVEIFGQRENIIIKTQELKGFKLRNEFNEIS